jgi:uncharacterized membrane protein YedE/YeeE
MIRLVALACGLLCGAGLTVGGLTDPARLAGYLGIGGLWDPTLALALLVAALVVLVASGIARLRRIAIEDQAPAVPPGHRPALRLLAGSLLFGLGWGVAGFFPAAALVAAGLFSPDAVLFLAAVLGGMGLFDLLTGRRGGPSGRGGWSRG